MLFKMKCSWCDKLFDGAMASCGTGSTWSLYKCPHCEKLMASGNIIPTVVMDDPEIKILGGYMKSCDLLKSGQVG